MFFEILRSVFGWCTVIDYGVLVIWFAAFVFAHDWMLRMHNRWFKIPATTFDALHYALMGCFKLGILLFNLAPYLALRLAGS